MIKLGGFIVHLKSRIVAGNRGTGNLNMSSVLELIYRSAFMRRVRQLSRNENVIAFVVLLCSLMVFLPLFSKFSNIQFNNDFLQLCARHAFFRNSILVFHQFPLRSPYIGGGFPILGDPEDPSLNPLIVFTLFFGEAVGLKLIALCVYLAGLIGMFLFSRREMGHTKEGAIYSTLLLAFSGWFHMRFAGGNVNELYYLLTPLILYFWRRYDKTGKGFLPLVLVFFPVVMDGKILSLTIPIFLLLFVLLDSFDAAGKQGVFDSKKIKKAFLVFISILALCALKIIPVYHLLAMKGDIGYPDIYSHAESYSRNTIQAYTAGAFMKGLLFDFTGNRLAPLGAPELYVGWVAGILFLAGIVLYPRKTWRLGFLFMLFSTFTLAYNFPVDIFKPVWRLPFLNAISMPYKYFNFFSVFLIALLGGEAFTYLREKVVKAGLRQSLVAAILVASLAPPFMFSYGIYMNTFQFLQPRMQPQKDFFQVLETGMARAKSGMYFNFLQNIGTINWYGGIVLPENAVPAFFVDYSTGKAVLSKNSRYRGEAYFEQKSNKITDVNLKPNRISVNVVVNSPDALIINQNYDGNFRATAGKLFQKDGLLAVKLDAPGVYAVSLEYRPIWFYLGLVVSILSLLILIFLASRPSLWLHSLIGVSIFKAQR